MDADRDRVTIQEAARRLGVSEGAIRKRVTRGTLEHDKEDDGRVYVYLDVGVDEGVGVGQDTGLYPNSSALISRLEDEVAYLRDENRRKDEIIMQQAMTMRQLTAGTPSEARESPVSPGPSDTPSEAPEGPHAGAQRPEASSSPASGERSPWWRRILGG
ncbi:MAG: hypothetical protein M3R38_16440 [Actinomycetota bacterium]|nr:hypothetical protein [Actinomycetota bacterium]